MDSQEMQLHNHQGVINRFVAACQADERVVAATLYGSYAKGTADAYSDLDLGLLTTDEAYEDFLAGREAFIRLLGEPVFLEDFDLPNMVFCIFPDGTEVELSLGRESQLNHNHGGPYKVLLDKKNILAGALFPRHQPTQAEQSETLRRLVYWFWHDLSHFIAALGRGQLWWAYGQLSSLQTTCCPLEPGAMLQAALVIVRFYREVVPLLARTHGLAYPAALDRVMSARLEKLYDARLS
jgi:predicted nucleotidyltransferase